MDFWIMDYDPVNQLRVKLFFQPQCNQRGNRMVWKLKRVLFLPIFGGFTSWTPPRPGSDITWGLWSRMQLSAHLTTSIGVAENVKIIVSVIFKCVRCWESSHKPLWVSAFWLCWQLSSQGGNVSQCVSPHRKSQHLLNGLPWNVVLTLVVLMKIFGV